MTEKRKLDIALVVMPAYLVGMGYNADTSHKELVQLASTYKGFSTGSLAVHITMALRGQMSPEKSEPGDGRRAYEWLMAEFARKPITISNAFRREIGNMAKKLKISPVQLIEFCRLLLIDVVNTELDQTDDEVPLEVV